MHAIETIIYTEMSNDWGKRLAITRLYAEILGSTGQEQIALEKLREVLDNAEMSSAHSTILNHARSIEVLLLTKLGKYTEAENICEELLAESAKQDVPRGGAVALTRLGIINKLRGNYEIANKHFAEAVQLFRDSDDRRGLGWSLLNLSDTELSLERFDLTIPSPKLK
jgi:tetratricopeptide (TPR) repeat protein